MIILRATSLHWLESTAPESDLCAHGGVVLQNGEHVLVSDAEEDWTVGAAGLYLLRTLEKNHTKESPVAEHLLPCCGHAMFATKDSDDVVIIGCPHGRDWHVIHTGDDVRLEFKNETTITVSLTAWRTAVTEFCRSIERFYRDSGPKNIPDEEDRRGFDAFWSEWKRRMAAELTG